MENIRVFNGLKVDAIITACASCALTLKTEYSKFLKINDKFKHPIYEISEFLANKVASGRLKVKLGDHLRVVYHDPCHLIWGLGIKDEPRKIIRGIDGITLWNLQIQAAVAVRAEPSICFIMILPNRP